MASLQNNDTALKAHHPLSNARNLRGGSNDFEQPSVLREALTSSIYVENDMHTKVSLRIVPLATGNLRESFKVHDQHPDLMMVDLRKTVAGYKKFSDLEDDIVSLMKSLPPVTETDTLSPVSAKDDKKLKIYALTAQGLTRVVESRDWLYPQHRASKCLAILKELKVCVLLGEGSLTDEGYVWSYIS